MTPAKTPTPAQTPLPAQTALSRLIDSGMELPAEVVAADRSARVHLALAKALAERSATLFDPATVDAAIASGDLAASLDLFDRFQLFQYALEHGPARVTDSQLQAAYIAGYAIRTHADAVLAALPETTTERREAVEAARDALPADATDARAACELLLASMPTSTLALDIDAIRDELRGWLDDTVRQTPGGRKKALQLWRPRGWMRHSRGW